MLAPASIGTEPLIELLRGKADLTARGEPICCCSVEYGSARSPAYQGQVPPYKCAGRVSSRMQIQRVSIEL